MNLPIEVRAQQLYRAAGAAGIVLTLSEAHRALRRYGGLYDLAWQFVERNARRNYRGGIQARIQQRIGMSDNRMQIDTPMNQAQRRRFVGPPVPKMKLGNAAPAGVQQLTYHKRKYGKARREPLIKRMKRQLDKAQVDMIARFQSLTSPQPTAQTLLTRYMSNFVADATKYLYTSCYCFNLSSLALQPYNGVALQPLYRLYKKTLVDDDSQAWFWQPEPGKLNDADGTADSPSWQQEHYEGNVAAIDTTYRHDWVDVKLMLQGTVKYPVRFHIYRVNFLMDGLGPNRVYTDPDNSAVTFDDALNEASDFNEVDYFWERFMMPKIVHPFAGTKKTGLTSRRHLNVISHEVVNIGSEVTISSDLQPLQHIHSMFIRSGKMYKQESAVGAEKSLMPVLVPPNTKVGMAGDGKPGFSDVNGASTLSYYGVDRSKDEWLMIVAENYQRTTDSEPAVAQDATNTPSFDIRVRNKFTMFIK